MNLMSKCGYKGDMDWSSYYWNYDSDAQRWSWKKNGDGHMVNMRMFLTQVIPDVALSQAWHTCIRRVKGLINLTVLLYWRVLHLDQVCHRKHETYIHFVSDGISTPFLLVCMSFSCLLMCCGALSLVSVCGWAGKFYCLTITYKFMCWITPDNIQGRQSYGKTENYYKTWSPVLLSSWKLYFLNVQVWIWFDVLSFFRGELL